jgi:hypothetical protein
VDEVKHMDEHIDEKEKARVRPGTEKPKEEPKPAIVDPDDSWEWAKHSVSRSTDSDGGWMGG